eukprot:11194164-Alexandrium_andersonii.AAC.1
MEGSVEPSVGFLAGAEAASALSGGIGRGERGCRRWAARPSGPPASLDLQGTLRFAPGADSNSAGVSGETPA